MTRARALKHTIRARAAKTGERYTTARRQGRTIGGDGGRESHRRPNRANETTSICKEHQGCDLGCVGTEEDRARSRALVWRARSIWRR